MSQKAIQKVVVRFLLFNELILKDDLLTQIKVLENRTLSYYFHGNFIESELKGQENTRISE